MKWFEIESTLRDRGISLFRPLELERLLGVSPVATRFLVHRYAKRGALLKLRNGLYCLANAPPSDLVLANCLYEPSYLSFEFALAYHHIIPETAYALTSATTRPTRSLAASGKSFEYHRVKPSVFTGYELMPTGNGKALIATPEKALVDFLYFVDLKKKAGNDRLNLRDLSRERLEFYAGLFERPSLLRLVQELR